VCVPAGFRGAKKILQKFENIKKEGYDVFIALKDQSGFGWNEELQVLTTTYQSVVTIHEAFHSLERPEWLWVE